MLIVHGVGGIKVQVKTKRNFLEICVSAPRSTLRAHESVGYGLDNIADIHKSVTPKQLQPFIPDVPLDELVRPKEVDHQNQSHGRPCTVGWTKVVEVNLVLLAKDQTYAMVIG